MKIYKDVSELIGKTPLIRLEKLEREWGSLANVIAKPEGFNPAGSAKDRVALQMLLDAEKKGLIKNGGTIIEPTSGNTGIGLASLAALRGYRAIFTMPETMSRERQLLLKAYGAEIVLTEGSKGMAGAIEKAKELAATIEGSFLAGQFENPSNAKAHYLTTGPEIWEDSDGTVDAFVACVGTGGTVTGTGRYLKEKNPNVRIVAIEPAKSAVLSGKAAGAHGIQGIGAGFVPEVLDTEIYDEIYKATEEEAYEAARLLAQKEGLLVGISSGAALACAKKLSLREDMRGKRIVVLLPDTGERYLSTPLFS
ncbi:MAG: cysteine synthase A [Ruminococcaceae bacterium]|nr:cysteine synthase A [Oscillospiraceae bacterium]